AAMAEPARPVACRPRAAAPSPMPPLMASVALALADADTPVWLDRDLAAAPEVGRWLAFQTGASVVSDPSDAVFAFVVDAAAMKPLSAFSTGTAEYPDRSTTVIVGVDGFDLSAGPSFSGPGFDAPRRFAPLSAPSRLSADLAANRLLFPRGVDLLFLADTALAGLPRSVRLAAE
ncbi:MAG TPA: phosphonate C-P lyase system protein PhnH, partial [Methylomirabilota bacterium]|nr:phosphonate C-P lyase system protein PhnH [Methylomirabilota bacterium]